MLLRYFGLIEQYLWLRMYSTLDFPATLDGQFASTSYLCDGIRPSTKGDR
jgi:hypothetical protein